MTTRILCVALRTTGTNCNVHSIVDIGAAWFSGQSADKPSSFGRFCCMWKGAKWDARTAELTGLTEAFCNQDQFEPTEAEALCDFIRWADADGEPIILAGYRPSMVRAFLMAAFKRADHFPKRQRNPQFHARVLDLHSLYVARCFRREEPVPSRGFFPNEIAAGVGLDAPTFRMEAEDAARLELQTLKALFRHD